MSFRHTVRSLMFRHSFPKLPAAKVYTLARTLMRNYDYSAAANLTASLVALLLQQN